MNAIGAVDSYQAVADAASSLERGAEGLEQGLSFADILAESLETELSQKTAMLGAPVSGEGSATGAMQGSGGLEYLIFTAAASGEAGDVEAALFMLCMMMQQEMGNSEMAPLLTAMSSMLTDLKSSGSEGTKAVETARRTVMQSDVPPATLHVVDTQVFGTPGGAALPDEAWKPVNMPLTGNPTNRSAQRLDDILDQFNVETAERYRPYRRTGRDTYCNIYVWDVTRTLGAEIPHYVDADGTPRGYPDVKGARELDANATYNWLDKHGAQYGWREVSAEQAQRYANAGYPAVTAWHNSNGAGHVQVVCPSKDGGFDTVRGVSVAQSGSKNTRYAHLSSTLRSSELKNVRYYVHD